MQSCMTECINTGEYRSHVNKVVETLTQHIHRHQQFLIEHLPDNANISTPQGGIVLWVQISGLNAVQLKKDAQKQDIDIRSSACFSTHDFYHDGFRIHCGWSLEEKKEENTVDKQGIYQQLKTLCELINDALSHSTTTQ